MYISTAKCCIIPCFASINWYRCESIISLGSKRFVNSVIFFNLGRLMQIFTHNFIKIQESGLLYVILCHNLCPLSWWEPIICPNILQHLAWCLSLKYPYTTSLYCFLNATIDYKIHIHLLSMTHSSKATFLLSHLDYKSSSTRNIL